MQFQADREYAETLDAKDELARYRQQFHIPVDASGNELLYLCGNSLGLQPKTVRHYVEQELQDWQQLGVRGHEHGRNPWIPYHEYLATQTSHLAGALPSEVVVMNTLTVNLHLMMVSLYRPVKNRHKIVIESNPFPSDRYAVESQIKFHGYDPEESLVELKPRHGEDVIRCDDIEEYLRREGSSVALVMLGGVNYYSGQAFDMERITRAGHAQGCVVAFDLAHAMGNIVLRLHDWDVDFAVWCSYKYLNGGPGTIGGCFVHERHGVQSDFPRFAGWWGNNKSTRFLMGPEFDPIPGAEGWQLSNPSVLSMAALKASLDIFEEIGMTRLRGKSELLTGYLEFLLRQIGTEAFSIISPSDPQQRGAQLSIRLRRDGKRIFDRLTGEGVVCDWREPDVIRAAPVPLYNSFLDVYRFSEIFARVVRV